MFPELERMSARTTGILMFMAGFIILFSLYHAAEYMIVFKNSSTGFLGFQVLFFVAAWLIAKWQTGAGLSAWGLGWYKRFLVQFALGVLMGIVLYGGSFSAGLLMGSEKIVQLPTGTGFLSSLLLFVFGNLFSSLSEDILTRGYVYRHLQGKMPALLLVVLSALIYVINHIYKLDKGPGPWIYLFALGLLYVVPLVLTKRLWFTGGMHWAGNCTFFFTHEIIHTGDGPVDFSFNYILALFALLLIPVVYWMLRRRGRAIPNQ